MMTDQLRADLLTFADNLEALAREAQAKGDSDEPIGSSPGYWYGVKFGFDTAAAELRQVLDSIDDS